MYNKKKGEVNMINRLREKLTTYFVGKEEIVDNVLVCLLAGGHVLLEDVPGVGKTTLARTLAKTIECDFGRIQFTPDTLPSDVVGTEIYNMKTGKFSVKEGAIMHQIILADEINRTSPKTQASMLEAMAEGQVTIGGVVKKLPKPFMVIATQNPVEFVGTYLLPEASMDRFMMKLTIGYPDRDEELRLAKNVLNGIVLENIESVCKTSDILSMQEEVLKVNVSDQVLKYIQNIVMLTREEPSFILGVSPRGMLSLMRASMAKAFLQGRDYVKPDDVKEIAIPTLHHRLVLTSEAKIRKENVDKKLESLVIKAKIPME